MSLNIKYIIQETLDSENNINIIPNNDLDNNNDTNDNFDSTDNYQYDNMIIEQAQSIAISHGIGALSFVKKLRSLQESNDSTDTDNNEESDLSNASTIAKNALKKGSEIGKAITKKIIKS